MFTSVFAACNTTEPLVDPDPNDYTVNVTFSAYIAQISLREGTGNIRIAVFNCDGKSEPPSFISDSPEHISVFVFLVLH
jgi:hypothetical protein